MMKIKPFLSGFIAVSLGALIGFAVHMGFALPGILPTSGLFMYILRSDLGHVALRATAGQAGPMIAVAIRAFPYSVVFGGIVGVVLRKFSCRRVLCYSVLLYPAIGAVLAHLAVREVSVSNPQQLSALQKDVGIAMWEYFCIYGWFFASLYASYAVSNRLKSRPPG